MQMSQTRAQGLRDVTHAQAIGQWLSAYTNMGVKAYQKEHASRRPTAEQPTSYEAAGRTTHQSNKLFSWLFKACIAYQLYDWLQVTLLDLKMFYLAISSCMHWCTDTLADEETHLCHALTVEDFSQHCVKS